nr:GDSL esterase/lipase LIP-4-like [Ipomoea batatas]
MCDGRLIIDFLCESIKADHLSPYLGCLTSNFANGVNFAIAGSKIVSRDLLFILSTQVLQFTRFRIFSLKLHSVGLFCFVLFFFCFFFKPYNLMMQIIY